MAKADQNLRRFSGRKLLDCRTECEINLKEDVISCYVRVMQWNILADGMRLCGKTNNKFPAEAGFSGYCMQYVILNAHFRMSRKLNCLI